MSIAALVAWIVTAVGGFVLLRKWITNGGLQSPRTGRFPPGLIFTHVGLAVAGLVVWIIYLVTDRDVLAWVALAILVVVAMLGFGLLARWVPGYRARTAVPAGGGAGAVTEAGARPPEQHLPVAVVVAHGVLAVATVVLVVLSALGVGAT
jgi:hypothetical protein